MFQLLRHINIWKLKREAGRGIMMYIYANRQNWKIGTPDKIYRVATAREVGGGVQRTQL